MRILSLDFETKIGITIHGPDFRDPNNDIYTQIWGWSAEDVCVVSNEHGWGRNLAFSLKDVDLIVGHNMGFDLCYVWQDEELKQFILKGGKIWDTQVAEYHLTGQQHAFSSLVELQLKHLGVVEKPSRISYLYKKGIGADRIVQAQERCPRLWKLYEEYCRTDGATPIKIYKKQLEIAKKEGMVEIIELYNDYLLAICNMTCTGIDIDVDKCWKTLRDFNEQHLLNLGKAQEIVKKYWCDPRLPNFNINSPDHKSAILFGGNIKIIVREEIGKYKNGNIRYKNVERHVWVDGFRVPTSISSPSKKPGLYSTDDGIMRKIESRTKNPLLKEYCALQKEAMMYKKAAKTYCQAFIDRSIDGRLYPNFNNTLTSTGRLSSSNPNLQNVSKRNKFGKTLHSLFVSPPGWSCVQIDFCLIPETKVLTEEFIWKKIGDVEIGEKLVGFEEHVRTHDGRKWQSSEVLNKKVIQKECLRITTSEGVITCSKDHMFLATRWGQSTLNWTKASDLNLKSTLTKVMEVWETPENNETGWGGGFLDGEGYISNSSQIGFGQNNDGHSKLGYDKMCDLFDKYLVNTENRVDSKRRCHKVRPAGLRTGWQAVGVFQPVRLKAKLQEQYQNTSLRSRNNRRVKILKIEDVGVMDVVALETSTHTFLAEGMLSHNCQLEVWVLALLSDDKLLQQRLLDGTDLHIIRLQYYNPDKTYEELYELCKVKKDPYWDKQRTFAKTVSYQMAYGAQPKKVVESTGLDLDIVETIFNKEKETYCDAASLGDKVRAEVERNATFSLGCNIPEGQKKGKDGAKILGKAELLPIFDKDGNVTYTNEEIRKVGYYQSFIGQKWAFTDTGRRSKQGISRSFSFTQPKNYPMQGTAATIQGATTAELLRVLLTKQDRIKMINEVHDSKLFYIRTDVLEQALVWMINVIEDVPKIFKERFNVDVPFRFPIDAECGSSFGEMEKVEIVRDNEGKCVKVFTPKNNNAM